MEKQVMESECVERRKTITDKMVDKILTIDKSQEVFRWLLSTFLVLYFVILGFSLQRIIALESRFSKVEVRIEMLEKFIKYNFNKLEKVEKQLE
jgi:hypothetical protein